MSNRTSNRTRIVLTLSVLFVLSALVPPSLAGGGEDPPAKVVKTTINGSTVHVKVQNLSNRPLTVLVMAGVKVNSASVQGFTPVTLFGGGTVETVVGFTGEVEEVEGVEIVENDSPF